MPVSPFSRALLRQPQFPATIDWSNPITRGLVALYVPTSGVKNLVNSSDALAWKGATAAPADIATQAGKAYTVASDAHLQLTTTAAMQITIGSLFWYGEMRTAGTIANSPYIWGLSHNNSDATPFDAINMCVPSGDATSVQFAWNATGVKQFIAATGKVTLNVATSWGFSVQGGTQTAYKNGGNIGSASVAGTIQYGTSPQLCTGGHTVQASQDSGARTALGGLWNRVLTANEHAELAGDPWQLLRQPSSMEIYAPAFVAPSYLPVTGAG